MQRWHLYSLNIYSMKIYWVPVRTSASLVLGSGYEQERKGETNTSMHDPHCDTLCSDSDTCCPKWAERRKGHSLQVAGLSERLLGSTVIGASPVGEKNQLCEDRGEHPAWKKVSKWVYECYWAGNSMQAGGTAIRPSRSINIVIN